MQVIILVEIFHDTRPITRLSDQRLKKLRDVLLYFTTWEDEINQNNAYNAPKNLMTSETRDDLHSSIQGFLSLCELTVECLIFNCTLVTSHQVQHFLI
jgi:hypothetical protein